LLGAALLVEGEGGAAVGEGEAVDAATKNVVLHPYVQFGSSNQQVLLPWN